MLVTLIIIEDRFVQRSVAPKFSPVKKKTCIRCAVEITFYPTAASFPSCIPRPVLRQLTNPMGFIRPYFCFDLAENQ